MLNAKPSFYLYNPISPAWPGLALLSKEVTVGKRMVWFGASGLIFELKVKKQRMRLLKPQLRNKLNIT